MERVFNPVPLNNFENVVLPISGGTCDLGCTAQEHASYLSRLEGVSLMSQSSSDVGVAEEISHKLCLYWSCGHGSNIPFHQAGLQKSLKAY